MIVYYCLLLFGSVHISTYQYIISIHINTSHMYDIFGVSVKKRGASPCWRGPTSGPSWGSAHVGDRHSRTWGRDAGHCFCGWNRIMTHLDSWKILSHDMYVYIYMYTYVYVYNLYICIHELHTLTKWDADRRTLFSKPSQILHGACILTNWKIFLNGPFIRIHRMGRSIPWKREASWNRVKSQTFQILYWWDPKFRRISY